jgi:hypothetical protein
VTKHGHTASLQNQAVQHGMASQGISITRKFKTQLSTGKILASVDVVWDSEGVMHIGFLSHGVTIIAQYYSNLLHSDVHHVIWK